MFCFTRNQRKHLQNICKNVLDVVTCKIKHFTTFLRPRHSRGMSTALKHFCKCFLLHVTTVLYKLTGAVITSCTAVNNNTCMTECWKVHKNTRCGISAKSDHQLVYQRLANVGAFIRHLYTPVVKAGVWDDAGAIPLTLFPQQHLRTLSIIYIMSQKTRHANFWQYLRQILADVQNYFTGILSRKIAINGRLQI